MAVQRAERALEVVHDRQQVDDQRDAGEAAQLVALLLGAPLVVLEVGLGAPPVVQVLLRVLLAFASCSSGAAGAALARVASAGRLVGWGRGRRVSGVSAVLVSSIAFSALVRLGEVDAAAAPPSASTCSAPSPRCAGSACASGPTTLSVPRRPAGPAVARRDRRCRARIASTGCSPPMMILTSPPVRRRGIARGRLRSSSASSRPSDPLALRELRLARAGRAAPP